MYYDFRYKNFHFIFLKTFYLIYALTILDIFGKILSRLITFVLNYLIWKIQQSQNQHPLN